MFFRPAGPRSRGARPRPLLGGWWLLVLVLFSACTLGGPRAGLLAGYHSRSLVPPSAPVPIAPAGFQREVRLGGKTPRQAAPAPERPHRSRASRVEVTAVEVAAAGPESAEREARQRALAVQLAFRGGLLEVSGSTRRISAQLA